MNILYLVNFNLGEKKGLGLITKNKILALKELVESVTVISSPFSNSYLRILYGFVLDLKAAWYVMRRRPNFVVSRGPLGFFTIFVSRRMGVKTAREVHAYAVEEIKLLRYKGFNGMLLALLAKFNHYLDLRADLRIFNHPDLLGFYKNNGFAGKSDFYVYNGYSIDNESSLTLEEARARFALPSGLKYLVFVGSATKWHGIEYIVELQKEFVRNGDPVRIICGGASIAEFDPEGLCLNFSPLNSVECGHLIKAADLCLLPIKNNRVSPGSPLKLYDYIVNKGVVVAQEGMLGYCDEVKKYDIGFCVNFSDSKGARDRIMLYIANQPASIQYPVVSASWKDRMSEWVDGMKRLQT